MYSLEEFNNQAINADFQRNNMFSCVFATTPSTKSFIPDDFDVLCAGFPCQAFSKAGNRLGFDDPTKGTLFFDICRILEYHRPQYAFILKVRIGGYADDIQPGTYQIAPSDTNQEIIEIITGNGKSSSGDSSGDSSDDSSGEDSAEE